MINKYPTNARVLREEHMPMTFGILVDTQRGMTFAEQLAKTYRRSIEVESVEQINKKARLNMAQIY